MTKTPRFTARRILQGSVAFAAFGGLTMAAALPAHADTVMYGSAHSFAAGMENVVQTPITPQGEEDSVSDAFQGEAEDYLTIDAESLATVDADGVHSTVNVNSAHAQVTFGDLEEILDGQSAEDDVEIQGSPEALQEEEEGSADEDADAEDGTDEEEDEAQTEDDVPDEATTLDDDTVIIDATFTGASISITQDWNGDYEFTTVNEGEVDIAENPWGLEIGTFLEEGEAELEEEGLVWDEAYGVLWASFENDDSFVHYPLGGVSAATSAVEEEDDDNGDDGDDGDNGDDGGNGDDGKEEEEDDKDGREDTDDSDDTLPVTGGALTGLVAAGALAAAGGGTALYLSRRKKANAASEDEAGENGED